MCILFYLMCVYIYLCVYMSIYIYVCVYICVCIYIYICMCYKKEEKRIQWVSDGPKEENDVKERKSKANKTKNEEGIQGCQHWHAGHDE